jgi:hypothetical protein
VAAATRNALSRSALFHKTARFGKATYQICQPKVEMSGFYLDIWDGGEVRSTQLAKP